MRVSASGIAGLFFNSRLPYTTPTGRERTGILQQPKAPSAPNDFGKNNIFPHGNVYEHKALEIVKRHYPDTHGQSAFARLLDRSKEFEPNFEADVEYAKNVHQNESASFAEFRLLQHWKAGLGSYNIHGVTYDIGRHEKKFGNATLVCQPDGLCDQDKTVIEIKCPFGHMYTPDNTEKWLKHIVQIALEMLMFRTEKAMLVIYFAPLSKDGRFTGRPTLAKKLTFTRAQLGPLMSKLAGFIFALGQHGSGDDAYQIYKSCESVVKPKFIEIQRLLQKVPLQFEDMVLPDTKPVVSVVFINDRSARLQVGAFYQLVAEPSNRFDRGAIRVMPGHALLQLPAPCYVTRAAKGSWLLPLLHRITSCRATSGLTLEITIGPDDSAGGAAASGAGASSKRRRHQDRKQIKLIF
ncbi:hypothetical protein N9A45_00685 [bacterium]|nr:hypothetical protein [bacterium]